MLSRQKLVQPRAAQTNAGGVTAAGEILLETPPPTGKAAKTTGKAPLITEAIMAHDSARADHRIAMAVALAEEEAPHLTIGRDGAPAGTVAGVTTRVTVTRGRAAKAISKAISANISPMQTGAEADAQGRMISSAIYAGKCWIAISNCNIYKLDF